MAKRIFAAIAVLLHAATVHGQLTPVAIDGCAKLARVVYSEVAASATYGPGKSGPWLIDLGQGDISICTHTARTVSRAFTSAMRSAGFSVNWHLDYRAVNAVPVDYCLNTFLSQCSPDRHSADVVEQVDPGFVEAIWAVVAKAVMREMYNPASSDEVRFRYNDLKLRIGLSLRSIEVISPRSLPNRQ